MRYLRHSGWIRLFAALAFLCFVGQGISSQLEHLGVGHGHHSHAEEHNHQSSTPADEDPTGHEHAGHHHYVGIALAVLEMSGPLVFTNPVVWLDELCLDGPVFDIEYPPQLS